MSDTLLGTTGFDGGEAAFEAGPPPGPVCEKCAAPLPDEAMTACPSCGWYAALNTHVEIAPEWEAACTGQAVTQPKSAWEVWATLVPLWGWQLIGSSLLIFGGCLGVRLRYAEFPEFLMWWSVAQLLSAAGLFCVTHLLAFFMAASTDPDMGVMDLVVSPLKAWFKILGGLPKRFWVLNTANIAICAVVSSFLILGHLPYDSIWDWGIKPPAKKNLLGAIADKAGGGGDEMDMDDALGSFTQNAAVNGDFFGDGNDNKDKGGKPERQKIDALIIGFQMTHNGQVDSFLLATEHNGRLYYAGRVHPKLTEDEADELPTRLMANRAPRPFVTVPGSAIWVKPKFTCRVTYNKRVESGMLQGIIWEELLGEVNVP